ncbi:MAG: pre-peptidase C-terminal domain-containing protein [Bryobacterales bacterium]|nr:pre-peptidase C-terminal domain-containing protein [Bryobacterales bacterium]
MLRLRFAVLAILAALPMAAEKVAPYVYKGGLEEIAQRKARLALPSLLHRRVNVLPSAHRLAPLTAEDLALKPTSMATRAGVHRAIAAPAARDMGRWETMPGGRDVWRMAIESPGAAGIRIHFRNFNLQGGRLWLHDGTGVESEIAGPYEHRGIWDDGDFWSGFVLSERIVVEYEPAAGASRASFDAAAADVPFTIAEISHLLPGVLPEPPNEDLAKTFGTSPSLAPAASAAAQVAPSMLSPLAAGQNPGGNFAAASCHLDISCFPEWAETARSVAHFVFEEDNSTYVCSGTLMRTTTSNNIPYLLTADHCVPSDTVARTVEAFWQYQTRACNGTAPNKRDSQRSLGARYLVSEGVARGDFSLIRLNSVPTGVVFAGWNSGEIALGTPIVGIHHPSGDYKRFSRGRRITTGSQLAGANPAFYYTVSYNEGLIEGGSSGSGLFTEPGVLTGMLSSGPKSETPCNIRPFPANYGKFSDAFPLLREYLEGRNTGGTNPPPGTTPPAAGQALVSGVARNFEIGPFESPTLVNGDQGFYVDVPAGATRLDVRITSVGAEPELGFWVRYESQPSVQNGRVVADHNSPGTSGFETLTIDLRSSPALRAGRYYIALGLFTTNSQARGTITATVSGTPAPTTNVLTPGVPRSFRLGPVQSGTLFNGNNGFRIVVPEGARRLIVKLTSDRPDVYDMDLFLRLGQDATVSGNSVVSDHSSTGPSGDEEINITQASQPALRPGTYFVGLALYTANITATGNILVTIEGGNTTTPPPTGGNTLTSGQPLTLNIPAQTNAVLLADKYQIAVPAGATGLTVRLSNGTPGIDYDLYVRRNSAPEVQNQRVVADFASEGASGDELITVNATSSPTLVAGSTYYIAVSVLTTGRAGSVTLTATVAGGGTTTPPPAGATGTRLTPGTPAELSIPAASSGRLLAGASGYYVTVPQGAQRLELQLRSGQDVDLDLYARPEAPPAVQGGKVQADYRATGPTGNETLVIAAPAGETLSGTYFVGVGVFTPGVDIAATLTAVTAGGGAAAGPTVLQSGVAATFRLAAAANAQLAPVSYAVDVPSGASRVEIRISSPTPNVDVDLYARHDTAPTVSAGKVQADHSSEGAAASETIVITPASEPALRAGRYYIALAVFTTGTAIDGSIVATVVGGDSGGAAPPSGASREVTPALPVKFNLPAVETSTLFSGDYGFRVVVPPGTRSMQLRLTADAPSVDTDMYVRYEADIDVADGSVVADHAAESASGNEVLTINASSEPPLRPGTYYIGLGLFTRNTPASGTISVTFERDFTPPAPPQSGGRVLTFGEPAGFQLPSVTSATLLRGDYGYRFTVPEARGRVQIDMRAEDPAVDVDLYVRFGTEPAVEDTRAVADYRAQGDTGDETLIISSASNPALRAGLHYLAFGVFTPNREAKGTLTATFTPDSQPTGGLIKEYELTLERVAPPEEALAAKPGAPRGDAEPLSPDAKDAAAHAWPIAPAKSKNWTKKQ